MGFPRGTNGKEPSCQCRGHKRLSFKSLGWEDPLEEEMATHSSIHAWRMPRMEEPGRLQSIGSQRVGHDWSHLDTRTCGLEEKFSRVIFKSIILHLWVPWNREGWRPSSLTCIGWGVGYDFYLNIKGQKDETPHQWGSWGGSDAPVTSISEGIGYLDF